MMRYQKTILSLLFCVFTIFPLLYTPSWKSAQAVTHPAKRDIHLFTVEYQNKLNNQKHEVYRFDPGSITIHHGEQIRLHIHGFHGKMHTFSIPGFNIKSSVKKGDVTTIDFTADQLGTFEIICHEHATAKANGPMIAYLTIVK